MNRRNSYPMLAGALRAASAALVLLSVTATPALAYVDPGTGAMLLQMIAAVFAGALFYFRSFWKRVAAWFSGARQDGKASADRTQPGQ